jgi:hypothetical protein
MARFNFLFSGDQARDRQDLTDFITGFAVKIGLPYIDVDPDAIDNVVQSLYAMPWPNGVAQSSAFKKVGILTTSFVYYAPIITTFPVQQFRQLADHQNSIVAYGIAKAALLNSTIQCPMRGEISLDNAIFTSLHFWNEFVSTFSGCNPRDHFQCISLLFEALAYRANPKACYTDLMAVARPDLIK